MRSLSDYHCRQNANCLNHGMQGATRSLGTAHRCHKLDGGFPGFQRPVWSTVAVKLGSRLAADRQCLLAVLQSHVKAALEVSMHARNGAHVHKRSAMDLPELFGINLVAGGLMAHGGSQSETYGEPRGSA